ARFAVGTDQTQLNHERRDERTVEFLPASATQITWQHDFAKSCADQTADSDSSRFEHAPDLAITTFVQSGAIPAIAAFTANELKHTEFCQTILKLDAFYQPRLLLCRQFAQHAHSVLSLCTIARMHEPVRQVTGGGQNKQALGVEIETPNRQPFPCLDLGKASEHGGSTAWIVVTDDFAGRLVIQNDSRRL